jgi:hypothetical protein
MQVKDRANFLVERYGDDCIQVVNSLLEDVQDIKEQSYWNEVLKTCKELLTNKNNSYA